MFHIHMDSYHIDSPPVPTEIAGLSIERDIFCLLPGVRTAALEAILFGYRKYSILILVYLSLGNNG